MNEINFRVVIPARYASTRFPGKPLRIVNGKTILEHVYRLALDSGAAEVIIATDDSRILDIAEQFCSSVCLTSNTHYSGTDRLAEITTLYAWPEDEIVVNLQVDELYVTPNLIKQVAFALEEHKTADIVTICTSILNTKELIDTNIVKVVLDSSNFALYFSRAPIPWDRRVFNIETLINSRSLSESIWLRHIGIYAYRVHVLQRFARLKHTPIEHIEILEQLRALWHGFRIYVTKTTEIPKKGIDTELDL